MASSTQAERRVLEVTFFLLLLCSCRGSAVCHGLGPHSLLSQLHSRTQVLVAGWGSPWRSHGKGSRSPWAERLLVRGSVDRRVAAAVGVWGQEQAVCLQKALVVNMSPSGTRGHTHVDWSGPS